MKRQTCTLNGTEQIFYFRTYTKYIVTIQYIYICHVWYMLHSDNSYACLRDNNSECIFFFLKKTTKHTHTRVHAHIHARTRASAHTHTYIWYRYTCLAFSKLYSFVKVVLDRMCIENPIHTYYQVIGIGVWTKALRTVNIHT